MDKFADRPNTIPWPPLIFIGMAAIAIALGRIWPLGVDWSPLKYIGAAMLLLGIAIEVWSFFSFRKHQTTIMPNKGAERLITSGPFAHSRNPIYLANTFLVSGAGFFFDNLWLIPSALIAALLTQELAIKREEKHLAIKFGEAWTDYTRRVSRWFPAL
jgi:protein-S-isoprenylcysteine O-methyltransferase Ste14